MSSSRKASQVISLGFPYPVRVKPARPHCLGQRHPVGIAKPLRLAGLDLVADRPRAPEIIRVAAAFFLAVTSTSIVFLG